MRINIYQARFRYNLYSFNTKKVLQGCYMPGTRNMTGADEKLIYKYSRKIFRRTILVRILNCVWNDSTGLK